MAENRRHKIQELTQKVTPEVPKQDTFQNIATASFIIGIIMIIFSIIVLFSEFMKALITMGGMSLFPTLYYVVLLLIDFIGIIFGFIGLLAKKMERAIIGLILCILSILLPIFVLGAGYVFY